MIIVIGDDRVQWTKGYTRVQKRDVTDISRYVRIDNNTSSVSLSWIVRDNHPLFIDPLWKTDNVEHPTRAKRYCEPHAPPTNQIIQPNVKWLLVLDEFQILAN